MPSSVDLHELANTPGAGVAESRLRAAGWITDPDEYEDGEVFTIDVEYSIGYRETVDVRAPSEQEAKRLARKMIEDSPGGGVEECVEIYTVETQK